MADKPLFTLDAEARWRLAYDPLQWIIQRRGSKAPSASSDRSPMHKPTWRGTDYIGLEKRVLRRCIQERGIDLTPEAQARLDALPEKFRDFLVDCDDLSPPACRRRAA